MNKHVLLLIGLAAWTNTTAQTGWLKHFSPGDSLLSVRILPDSYAFLANNAEHVYQIRVDADGQPTDSLDLGVPPHDIAAAAEGHFFKAFLENPNIRLQKLDTAGILLWEIMTGGERCEVVLEFTGLFFYSLLFTVIIIF